jgi:hypothetical protein
MYLFAIYLWCYQKHPDFRICIKLFLKDINVKDTNRFLEWSVGDREVACHLTRSVNASLLVPYTKALISFDIVTCQGFLLG